ncbi:MAG: glycosyltransferase [bacterium]
MPRSYRILHIDTDRTWRGGQQQVASLLKQLHRFGHTNFIASPSGSELLRRLPPGAAQACPVSMRNEWDLVSAFRLARVIRREHPDLLHAHSGRAHTLGILARAFSGLKVPLVVARRVDFVIRPTLLNRWKYCRADLFIAVSMACARRLADAGVLEKMIQIIPDCVDPQRFENTDAEPVRREFGIAPSDPVIGHMASCEEIKGQKTLILSAAELIRERADLHLIIVGEGPSRPALMELVENLGISNHVHFPGFRHDVGNFLCLFDIFVIPSLEEGLCSAILEAQLFALPVVASRVGGIPEIVQDGVHGFLVPPNDPAALAAALRNLLESPGLRSRMGRAGREQVLEWFTAEQMAKATAEIYNALVAT